MSDTQHRLGVLGVISVALLLTLLVRLWWLQVVSSDGLAEEATAGRIRVVHEEAPRGRIFDRNMNELVGNEEIIVVTVDPRALADAEEADDTFDREAMFERLATDVSAFGTPLTIDAIDAALEDPENDPLKPIPVAKDVNELLEVYLLERHREFPGVDVDRQSVRSYPYGSVGAHVLGYVGSITGEELEAVEDEEAKPYLAGDEIGKTGLEATYEDVLRGVPGQRTYEIDAEGNIVRLIEEQSRDPIPGSDIMTSLDVDLQAYAEEQLATVAEAGEGDVEQARASVVVQDPQTGEVLTMASYPTYQPSEFVAGISPARYEELQAPNSGLPLNNWAIQGEYPPASTFKLISGYAALAQGMRGPADAIGDPGEYFAEGCSDESCRFQNDNATPYGTVNLQRALTVSSDVYFYGIGDAFWYDREEIGAEDAFQQHIAQWGFGEQTGIDLPSERDGLLPTPELMRNLHEENPEAFPYGDEWRSGNNILMAIGQGDMNVTPLQLNNAYASFANGGTVRSPFLVRQVLEERDDGNFNVLEETTSGEVLHELEIPDDQYQAIQAGLLGVTQSGEGTASEAFEGFDQASFPVAGKTGTAQVESQTAGNALFSAFGPVNAYGSHFAITAVFQETSLYGGEVAAPFVRSLFDVISGQVPMPPAMTTDQVLGADGQDPDELTPGELAAAAPGIGAETP